MVVKNHLHSSSDVHKSCVGHNYNYVIIYYYYISSQTKSQLTQVFKVMLLSLAFGRVVIMNGEL